MMTGLDPTSFELTALVTGKVVILGLSLPSYQASFLGGALIATAFMLGAIAIQHPFNACLGPNWTQDRMLMLAAECGFLSMITAAVMSMPLIPMSAALVSLFVAVIGWYYTYSKYIELSRRDAAAWLESKPIPDVEGH
jgi:tetrahydromethanopterin S-methyltransferase subunit C